MNKKVACMFRFCLPMLMLFFVVGAARAAWPVWKGGEYYNDTYTDPFSQQYWSAIFSGADTYTFLGRGEHSLAGKWLNLVLRDDVTILALAAKDGDHTASYTINLDMNGKDLTSTSESSNSIRWEGGEGADPGVVLNVTNSSETASVLTWPALYIARESNSVGTVNVSGPNVTLSVPKIASSFGLHGIGTLNVTDGAAFNLDPPLSLGNSESGFGSVNVSGSGSIVTSSIVYAWTRGGGSITVKDGAFWYSSSTFRLGVEGYSGYGTALISGTGSVFSAEKCEIAGATLTVADGGHLEVRKLSSVNNYHFVGPNGTLRFDNGTLSSAGRWTFQSGSTVEFVLKDARTIPFLDVDNEWVILYPDVNVGFEMDQDANLKAGDFIPLAHGSAVGSSPFEGYPEDHEFSVPYGQYAYTFRINYGVGPSGDKTLGLTVLNVPPGGTLIMLR